MDHGPTHFLCDADSNFQNAAGQMFLPYIDKSNNQSMTEPHSHVISWISWSAHTKDAKSKAEDGLGFHDYV